MSEFPHWSPWLLSLPPCPRREMGLGFYEGVQTLASTLHSATRDIDEPRVPTLPAVSCLPGARFHWLPLEPTTKLEQWLGWRVPLQPCL